MTIDAEVLKENRKLRFRYFLASSAWQYKVKKFTLNTKRSFEIISKLLLLNIEMATTYLSGRLPSEYCRRWKSLRPCSGWERVVSFLFVTIKSFSDVHWKLHNNKLDNLNSGKALVRLVMLDYVCCQTSICILSTSCSATGLTSLCYERSHLMVGFVLICFQHLSTWNTATGRLPRAR